MHIFAYIVTLNNSLSEPQWTAENPSESQRGRPCDLKQPHGQLINVKNRFSGATILLSYKLRTWELDGEHGRRERRCRGWTESPYKRRFYAIGHCENISRFVNLICRVTHIIYCITYNKFRWLVSSNILKHLWLLSEMTLLMLLINNFSTHVCVERRSGNALMFNASVR